MVTKFGQLVDLPERNLEYTLSQVLLIPSPCGHNIFRQNLIYPPVFGERKGGFEFVFFSVVIHSMEGIDLLKVKEEKEEKQGKKLLTKMSL